MKKSELIEILALAYANLPPNSSPKAVAKEMLRVAEKHGMMPPVTKKVVTKGGWDRNKQKVCLIEVLESVIMWDEE